ncbi:MAG TPA: XTP/dITP diphosphatase [Defluviitaleaceae bacterium]|nr:XTP/dITP diphosphatase [Defluviitaleaceae bacterium]HPT76429.1 XTP/dITP diphosphatase [Defluviitaleaceae bacterium]HQD50265.1 XTP/dITP diphosphatase [Defluviitaleaceae bacterium]
MRRIIFATKNQGKIAEIQEIMKELNLEILSLESAGIDTDIIENGSSFEENAIIKVKEIMKLTNDIVMADDSGLEIDYLNGAPGVYSSRFEGENTPYDIKNNKILSMLEGVPDEKRTARFVCVIAAGFPNGEIITTKGTIEGRIGYEIKGENGFGYDPIFYVPEYNMTTAQMSPQLKNQISHRAKALNQMKAQLRIRLGEILE